MRKLQKSKIFEVASICSSSENSTSVNRICYKDHSEYNTYDKLNIQSTNKVFRLIVLLYQNELNKFYVYLVHSLYNFLYWK